MHTAKEPLFPFPSLCLVHEFCKRWFVDFWCDQTLCIVLDCPFRRYLCNLKGEGLNQFIEICQKMLTERRGVKNCVKFTDIWNERVVMFEPKMTATWTQFLCKSKINKPPLTFDIRNSCKSKCQEPYSHEFLFSNLNLSLCTYLIHRELEF